MFEQVAIEICGFLRRRRRGETSWKDYVNGGNGYTLS